MWKSYCPCIFYMWPVLVTLLHSVCRRVIVPALSVWETLYSVFRMLLPLHFLCYVVTVLAFSVWESYAPVFSVWGSYCPCHLFMKELLSLISMYLFRAYLTCLRLPLLSVSPYTLIGSPIALITCKEKKDQYQIQDSFHIYSACMYLSSSGCQN